MRQVDMMELPHEAPHNAVNAREENSCLISARHARAVGMWAFHVPAGGHGRARARA